MIPKSKIRLSRNLRAQTTPYPNAKSSLKKGMLLLLVLLIVGIYAVSRSAKNPDTEIASDSKKQVLGEQQNPLHTQTYTVKEGDTLFNVANRYDIDWEAVAQLNGLEEPFILKIGQVLKLPQ